MLKCFLQDELIFETKIFNSRATQFIKILNFLIQVFCKKSSLLFPLGSKYGVRISQNKTSMNVIEVQMKVITAFPLNSVQVVC